MKRRHKAYLKINVISLIFIVVSFISVTLAWFAYSGLSSTNMEVNVKAWYIELEKDGKTVSNDIVISLDDIYPGMETVNEVVKIKNKGDSDAQINYSIKSARILDIDNYTIDSNTTTEFVEDKLSHEYPFHININLSKNYALSKTDESIFNVSISWPLDSGTDELDSNWGTDAYNFQKNEIEVHNKDNTYEIRPSIKVVISIKAEQYIDSDNTSDVGYNLGDEVLFDVENNNRCVFEGGSCLKTHVIDVNNRQKDNTVTLLPDVNTTYVEGEYSNYSNVLNDLINTWHIDVKSKIRPLTAEDILKIASTDIINSFLIRNSVSNLIIGNLKYQDQVLGGPNKSITYSSRLEEVLSKAIISNGYYSFSNKYSYLFSNNCYWVDNEYSTTSAFAVKKMNESTIKLYGEPKQSICKIVPVIVASKNKL